VSSFNKLAFARALLVAFPTRVTRSTTRLGRAAFQKRWVALLVSGRALTLSRAVVADEREHEVAQAGAESRDSVERRDKPRFSSGPLVRHRLIGLDADTEGSRIEFWMFNDLIDCAIAD
jgi:hypothetical protein